MGIKSILKSILKSGAFHANGRPRGWLRRLVFDKTVVHSKDPKRGFYYLVYGFDGQPRPAFASWILPGLNARKQFDSSTGDKKRTDIIQSKSLAGILAGASRISIITTVHCDYVAVFLQTLLKPLCGEVVVLYDMPKDFPDDLYFVICPHQFNDLPPPMKRIVYQLEQSDRSPWFTQNYIDILSDSLAIFDYNIENIAYLQSRGILYRDIFYMPVLPLVPEGFNTEVLNTEPAPLATDFDVLFYGTINDRRKVYLDRLRREFRVKVAHRLFGAEREALIKSAPLVVNIHHYKDSFLETTRLSEVLGLGGRIVSETAIDQSNHSGFEDSVIFCPSDDVESMVLAIKTALKDKTEQDSHHDVARVAALKPMRAEAGFFFYRALLALGMIDYSQFYDLTHDWVLPDEPLLLNLPENPDRRIWAQVQYQQNSAQKPPVIFNGLRHRQSWIGCAFSYKYIGQKAIEQGIKQVQIQEDDAKFLPQYDSNTAIIRDYLAENIGEWDGFVGLLIDCPQSAKITRVSEFNGLQFIHIDFFISMVYGIYATPMLDKMADYPLKPFAQMTKKDAIDTYLNRPPVRVVTVAPFIVEHCTEFDSTLWPVNNAETTASIEATQARLAQMVKAFLATKGD